MKILVLGVRGAQIIIGNDYEIALIKERVKDWQEFFPQKNSNYYAWRKRSFN